MVFCLPLRRAWKSKIMEIGYPLLIQQAAFLFKLGCLTRLSNRPAAFFVEALSPISFILNYLSIVFILGFVKINWFIE